MYERHKFNIRNQEENESIDQYVTELRTLASTCEFENLKDGLIRDRIVCGIRNQTLKKRLFREADLTLKKAVDICSAAEISREQVKSLTDSKPADVDALNKSYGKPRHGNFDSQHNDERKNHNRSSTCGNCGRRHEAKSCPAYGKECHKCHIDTVNTTTTSSPVETIQEQTPNQHASLTINHKTLRLKLDSGAETNILTKADFDKVVPKRQRISKMRQSNAKLTAYGGHSIPVIGKCYLRSQYKTVSKVIEFQIVENGKSLLGCNDCKNMNLITFHNVDQLRSGKLSDKAPPPPPPLRKYS